MTSDVLRRLEGWYTAQCNDVWEHQYGVLIETIDNPGWRLRIDLTRTALANQRFEEVTIERNAHDWIHCKVLEQRFEAFGGPRNLSEMTDRFLNWADSASLKDQA
jgi:hypothetical protein